MSFSKNSSPRTRAWIWEVCEHDILILPDVVFKIVVVFRLIEVANIDADTVLAPRARLLMPDSF